MTHPREKIGYLNGANPLPQPTWRPPQRALEGCRIGLFSPSEPVGGGRRERLGRNVATLESLGFRTRFANHALAERAYEAGTREQRVQDIHELIAAPDIDVLLATWGGKSCNQLLEYLDYDAIARSGKPFSAFSDGCVLVNAITARTGLFTFHGPNVAGKLDETTHQRLDRIVGGSAMPTGNIFGETAADVWRSVRGGLGEGRLFGGNLTTFVLGLAGTRFLTVDTPIVFFWETIGTPPEIIDQYLSCLRLTGFLDRVTAMIIGDVTDADDIDWKRRNVMETVLEVVNDFDFPVVWCPTFGHRALENPVVPIGPLCRVDADRGIAEFLEPVVA